MTFIFLIFGLAIGGFQTLILRQLWQLSNLPKWIMFVFTPTLILLADLLGDDQMTAFTLFGSFASIFILVIISIIFQTDHYDNGYRNRKSYSEIVKDYKQPFYLNPAWGIIYQLYVITMIILYIFVPKKSYNVEINYNNIENDLILQLLSLFVFTGFSIIILLYQYLNSRTYYLPTIFTIKKIISTPKEALINKIITISITCISLIFFLIFCYDRGVYNQLKEIFQTYNSSTFLSINTALIAFIIFNTIILFINPQQVAKRNLYRIVLLIRSAFLSIFISAALVIPLMILEDRFSYFNMSSEIILFLGFNFVLLINEISLFIKYKKNELD